MVEEIRISIRKLPGHEDIPFPCYMTEKSAGMDIFAAVAGKEVIPPGERRMIPTGIAMAIPEGYEAPDQAPERSCHQRGHYLDQFTGNDRCGLPGRGESSPHQPRQQTLRREEG